MTDSEFVVFTCTCTLYYRCNLILNFLGHFMNTCTLYRLMILLKVCCHTMATKLTVLVTFFTSLDLVLPEMGGGGGRRLPQGGLIP